ncbi:putative transcription factor bHLH family [Lupinus albus]|uniref:Putative transcription factor bHLH family n=1 Tax=Lupinus albus TaxID=3870 RepID=A0A6A4QWR4_LUPAL|nr:putative transcription factor bHLH family [Lupinus albus]
MDHFFSEKFLGEIFLDDPLLAPNQSDSFVQYYSQYMKGEEAFPHSNQSAFSQYRDQPRICLRVESSLNGSSSQNMNKRMIAFLKKGLPVEKNKVAEYEKERCFRHMINERMRRQRQRECCLALHSILPHGTKTDTNSVVQVARKEIQRLQGYKEELKGKIESNLEAIERNKVGGRKVQYLRVPYPECGIDSVIETLNCLKTLGVDTRSIKSNFSKEELFAVFEIEENKVS